MEETVPKVLLRTDSINLGAEKNISLSFTDVFKKISGLALPMGMSFTFSFEVFLAVILLQNLSESEDDTAAAALVSVLMNSVCVLAMAPLFAVAINLSGKLGAWREYKKEDKIVNDDSSNEYDETREKEKIESANINSLLIASAVTVPSALILYYSKPLLTSVFGQNDAVASSAAKFLEVYSFAVPGLMARMALEQVMFSFGKSKPAMWMALGSLAIGAPLSILLGFGVKSESLQIPKMGQRGVALGFLIESYLTAISYGFFVKFNKECREFDFYKTSIKKICDNLDGAKEILRLGGSIAFTVGIELSLTLAIGVFSGLLGTKEQSAMSYNMQFIYFEFIMLAAFSFSCTQEISREKGANKLENAQKIAKYGLLTTLIYLTPIPVFFAIYPKALEAISGGASKDISDQLTTLVPIMCSGVILDAVRYNLLQQSRALDDLFVPNTIALLGMSSGIGLAAGLGLGTSLNIDGVGMGYTIGLGVTAGAMALRWRSKVKELFPEKDDEKCWGIGNPFAFFSPTREKNSSVVEEITDGVSPDELPTSPLLY